MKTKILLIVIIAMFASCKPIKEIQYLDRFREVVKVDSVYKFQKDTVFSVKIGDTIYVNRVKTLVDYKYKMLSKVDTVTEIQTKVKTVTEIKEKKITAWIGRVDWLLIIAALGFGVFRLLKFLKII